jgi:rhodanese-related sulfurtransferase
MSDEMSGKSEGEGSGQKKFTYLKPADMFSLMGMAEQSKFNLIDVRKPVEFNQSHLSGATSMPVDDLSARIGELDNGKTILVYCQKGKRCLQAVDILDAKGFHDVLVLEGGLDFYYEYLKSLNVTK